MDEVRLTLLTGSASVKGLVVGNPARLSDPASHQRRLDFRRRKSPVRAVRQNRHPLDSRGIARNHLRRRPQRQQSQHHPGQRQRAAKTPAPPAQSRPMHTAQAKSSKKFEVDDLLITGAKVHVSLTDLQGKEMTLSLPPIHLTDLGKNPEGITATDLTRSVLRRHHDGHRESRRQGQHRHRQECGKRVERRRRQCGRRQQQHHQRARQPVGQIGSVRRFVPGDAGDFEIASAAGCF